jgi:hypothetical protein
MARRLARLNPQDNTATRVLFLVTLLMISAAPTAFAQQTNIPILDGILQFIEDNKAGIAMVGVAVAGVGLLSKVFAPDWSRDHRGGIVSMVLGGIILAMVPEIANMIVGS